MISTLLNHTCAKIELAKRLKDAQSEVKAVEATQAELDKLLGTTRQLISTLEVCRDRLGEESISPVLTKATVVAQEVQASRKRFAEGTNRRENPHLSDTGRKVQTAFKDLSNLWRNHAQAQLDPYLELLHLVTYLPEVAASEQEIRKLVSEISTQLARPPQSPAQLDQFDERLADLGRRLESVSRLPNEVRSFLTKVVERKATLTDITPPVWSWVEEGGRASSFSIIFAVRRG